MDSLLQLIWNLFLLVAGAALGLAGTAAFDHPLRKRFDRLKRRIRVKGNSSGDPGRFEIGALKPECVIVEGDGTQPISEELVHIVVKEEPIELPPQLAEWREEIAREQERLRADNRKHFWNGENYAVVKVSPVRRKHDEAPEIFIELSPSDYYSFLATQQLDRRFPDGTTPRSRYLDPYPPAEAPPFMSISFGASVLAVTADNQILLRKRGRDVGSRPGFWSVSADEGISKTIDSAGRRSPRLHDLARRGLWEELALTESEYRLSMLAITIDIERHQWDSVFVAYLHDVRSADLKSRLTRGVPDPWEHEESLDFVPFDCKSVLTHLLRDDRIERWTPLAPAAIYLALVHEYGKSEVEKHIARLQ